MHLEDSLLKHLTYMLFNVIIRSAFIVLCLKAASSIDLYFFYIFFQSLFLFGNFLSIGGNLLDIYILYNSCIITAELHFLWICMILMLTYFKTCIIYDFLDICLHVQLEFDGVCINSDIVCNWHLLCSFMLTVMEAGCWKSRDLTRISRLELW